MDFTVIVQRLNELTTFMNNVRTLSKKIFELPDETAGNKLVAVWNETDEEPQKFDLTAALQGMYSLTNGLTAIGNIVRDGADFTFEVGFEWKINGIEYANEEITRTINDAGTGNHRIDIAVADTNNDIYIIEGFEVPLATAVVQPPTPPNTIFLCSFLITESVIGDNTSPETSGQNNIPLKVNILSTDLATNDIAGFVTYINELNPPLTVLEINSLVQYYLTDTNDIYQFVGVGKGVYGQDNLQITSSNVIKFSASGAIPSFQQVTDVVPNGNETTNIVKFVVDADNYIEIDTVNLSIKVYADGVLFNDINQEGIINYAFGNPDYYSSLTNGALFVGSLLSSDASIFDLNKIINNGVDYSLPTGASSQIATLADITGGGGYTVVSSNTTASNDTNYTVVANSTFTDPSPTEGKGYVVYVRNGTATIGGTGYSVGSLVFRVFHSGAWSTREYKSNLTASDIPSGIDAVKIADGSVSNTEFQYINSLTSNAQTQLDLRVRTLLNDNVDSSAVTGTVANTILKSYLIPANTLAVGDTIDFKSVCSKVGTNANSNFRLYTNTSNSLTGASALALVSPSATNLYFSLDRTYTLKSGNTLESFPVGSTAPTDEVATTTAISNTAFNPAVDNYFIVAIQPNNASDIFKQTLCYITLMKSKTTI
jgi:hypothetical protein